MNRVDIEGPEVGYEHHSGLTTYRDELFTGEVVEYFYKEVVPLTIYVNGAR